MMKSQRKTSAIKKELIGQNWNLGVWFGKFMVFSFLFLRDPSTVKENRGTTSFTQRMLTFVEFTFYRQGSCLLLCVQEKEEQPGRQQPAFAYPCLYTNLLCHPGRITSLLRAWLPAQRKTGPGPGSGLPASLLHRSQCSDARAPHFSSHCLHPFTPHLIPVWTTILHPACHVNSMNFWSSFFLP